MNNHHINNIFNNFSFGLIRQILFFISKFVLQTIFIRTLGVQYLGVNGLFNDILMYLAISELGFSASMAISLYSSIANKDEEKIKKIIKFFRKIYFIIGCIFIFGGLCFLPFLNSFIKLSTINLNYYFIFIIVLLNASIPYFFFPNIQYLYVNEKQYIIDKHKIKFDILLIFFQCLALIILKNYYIYLILQLVFTIIYNLTLNNISKNIFTILNEKIKTDIEKSEKKAILKKTLALFSNTIGAVIINSSDRMIIASFLGLIGTGVYTNYVFITSNLGTFIGIFINAISATIGNYSARESKEATYNLLKKVLFANYTIGLLFSQLYIFLMQPFISFWAGKDFLADFSFPLVLGVHFILMRMKEVVYTFKHNMGILEKDQIRPLLEAIVNIIISIILVKKYGITGVVLGTVLAYLLVSFIWEPYTFLKHSGLKNKVFDFFLNYIIYFIEFGLITFINYAITNNICIYNNYITFFINGIIVMIITIITYLLVNINNKIVCDILNSIKRIVLR